MFEALNILDNNIHTIANNIKDALLSSAAEFERVTCTLKNKPWLKKVIMDLCNQEES
ncbi:hypothetical protein DPMN_113511 [Dreissena polymorpha]|uniref:Uncharacterized protein n=1 Tax=Dreissena polymorpha TaxID=45954 RepID=A0A9D4KIF4_DREPO|nr:hypothetical protein DPMN_113511 [Dreissena polymorpha]